MRTHAAASPVCKLSDTSSIPSPSQLAQLLLDRGADTQIVANRGEKPYEAADFDDERMRVLCGAPSWMYQAAPSPPGSPGEAPASPPDSPRIEALSLAEHDAAGVTPLQLAVGSVRGDDCLEEEPL